MYLVLIGRDEVLSWWGPAALESWKGTELDPAHRYTDIYGRPDAFD